MSVFAVDSVQCSPSRSYGASPVHSAMTWSMHSCALARRSTPDRVPNISQSDASPPGLTPRMKRPSSSVSSIATFAASAAGWLLDRFTVPVPSVMRSVSCTRLARKTTQSVIVSAASVTCSPT